MSTALFKLARVMGCGRILRTQFEMGPAVGQAAKNRITTTGVPDYLPGQDLGKSLTVTYGGVTLTTTKLIGTLSHDHNEPQAWHDGYVSGGAMPTGTYIFQVVICDAAGTEKYTCHWTAHGNSTGSRALDGIDNSTANAKCKLQWRQAVPSGGSVKLFGARQPIGTTLAVYQMKLIKTIPFVDLDSPTSYTLTDFPTGTDTIAYSSTTWLQEWLLPAVIPFNAPVTITAPAGLIVDELGNATEAVTASVGALGTIVTLNESDLGTDGWVARPENTSCPYGTFTFAQPAVHVSFQYGNDTSGTGAIGAPYKTIGKALLKYNTDQKNINIRLLRGDVWPTGDFWTRSHFGNSRGAPFLVDDYWNPAYGTDPLIGDAENARPTVTVSHPYWDMVQSTFPTGGQQWSGASPNGTLSGVPPQERPYTVYSGIYFKADPAFASYAGGWPGGGQSDHQRIIDCRLDNVEVNPSNTTTKRPTTGSMIYRCQMYHVSTGSTDTFVDTGSGGTTLVLPMKFARPWLAQSIAAGRTTLPLKNEAPPWRLDGWNVTVSDASHTETVTITGAGTGSGGNRNYPISPSMTFGYNASNSLTTVVLSPPDGTQFQIRWGTGKSTTTYTLSGYNPTTRSCTVTPSMPALDSTTRIKFLPETVGGGRNSAMFSDNTSDFVLCQSLIDQHGWALLDDPAGNDAFSHGIYNSFQARGWAIYANWVTNNASYGIHHRGGGSCSYNMFVINTHALDQSSTAGCAIGNVLYKNGQYQIQGLQKYDDIANHEMWDGNIIMLSSGNGDKRTDNWGDSSAAFGLFAQHSFNEGAPKNIRARHNLLLDCGGIWLSTRPPVNGTYKFERNLIVNRAGTGQTQGGNPYRIHSIASQAGWGVNGPLSVTENDAWIQFNQNCYLPRTNSANFSIEGTSYATLALFKASATNGVRDTASIQPAAVNFANGSYGMENWAGNHGFDATIPAMIDGLRRRPPATFTDFYDALECRRAFEAAYTPALADVPQIDGTPTGYYGPVDDRTTIVFYTLSISASSVVVGTTVTCTVTPLTNSSETLNVALTGATPNVATISFGGDTSPRTFTFTPSASGVVTVEVKRGSATILGPNSVAVNSAGASGGPTSFQVQIFRGPKLFKKKDQG